MRQQYQSGDRRGRNDFFARRLRGTLAVAVIAAWCASWPSGVAWGQAGKADPAPKVNPADVTAQLTAMSDVQQTLVGTLAELRGQLTQMQESIDALRDEIRQDREAFQAEVEQTKGMREEVRGLYVESSGLKGDIAQLGQRVESFEQILGTFRFSSGAVLALVILLQLVLLAMQFRGHG